MWVCAVGTFSYVGLIFECKNGQWPNRLSVWLIGRTEWTHHELKLNLYRNFICIPFSISLGVYVLPHYAFGYSAHLNLINWFPSLLRNEILYVDGVHHSKWNAHLMKFDLNCHRCRASGQLIKICFILHIYTLVGLQSKMKASHGDKCHRVMPLPHWR